MVMLQKGTFTVTSREPGATGGDPTTFERVSFPTPFPDGSTVFVLPMVSSCDGAHTPGLEIADITSTGFKIGVNGEVMDSAPADRRHTAETIGWIAVSL